MAAWQPEPAEAGIARAERILDGSFAFLNHTTHLPRVDWRTRQGSRLWSFHLHYFGYALQLVALCDAARYPVAPGVRERLAAMARALAILARPDGTLHLFNDAPDSPAPPVPWLRQLAARVTGREAELPSGPVALPHGGYRGWLDDARGERLLIDCGPLGAEQQPGLGHCDMLSYELDVGGQAIVCDGGVSGCEPDALRAYVRSTRAHNTVTIDGREQHELWGTCRVARLGTPLFATHLPASDPWEFHGACAPYHAPRMVHHRVVRRQDGTWTVTDRVDGGAGRRLDSYIHLHPGCTLQREGDGFVVGAAAVRLRLETFGVDAVTVHQGKSSPAQGWYCPELGMALPAPVFRLTVNANHEREFGYRFRR